MNKLFTLTLLLLFSVGSLMAATFTTVQDGDWDDPNTWDLGSVPLIDNAASWPGNDVVIAHTVTRTGDLATTKKSSILIQNGGSLAVNGNLTLSNGNYATFVVEAGGDFSAHTLAVSGYQVDIDLLGIIVVNDFNLPGTQNPVYLSGSLTVNNDMTLSDNSYLIAEGATIIVNQDLSLGSSTRLTMTGDILTVGNDLSLLGNSSLTTEQVTLEVGNDLQISNSAQLSMKKGTLLVEEDLDMDGNARLVVDETRVTIKEESELEGSARITIDGGAVVSLGDLTQSGSADIAGVGTGGVLAFRSVSLANPSTTIRCTNLAGCIFNSNNVLTIPNPLDLTTGMMFLPVELLHFRVNIKDDHAFLKWATATESGNAYFLIEHSRDGRTFATLGQVAGAGNSQTLTDYYFTHDKLAMGIHYYRLWQFDYDGSYELLGTRRLELLRAAKLPASFYPNPASAGGFLQSTTAVGSVDLYNSGGQFVAELRADGQRLPLPTGLPGGIYFIRWQQAGASLTERIMINPN